MRNQKESHFSLGNTVNVGAFSPIVAIGNPEKNVAEILDVIQNNINIGSCDIVVTPELSITGYTCQDMFSNKELLTECNVALNRLWRELPTHMILAVGAPVLADDGRLYNCMVVGSNEGAIAIYPKNCLANYGEFYEDRWFTSGTQSKISKTSIARKGVRKREVSFGSSVIAIKDLNTSIGCEVCEDLWAPEPPSAKLALGGAMVILNGSASNEIVGKAAYRRDLVRMQSARTLSAYIYCSAGPTESVSDTLFSGHNIIAENGKILAESDLFDISGRGIVTATIDLELLGHERMHNKTFANGNRDKGPTKVSVSIPCPWANSDKKLFRTVSMTPFVPEDGDMKQRAKEIVDIQATALARRWLGVGSQKLIIGVSGGLDSTLALLVCHRASRIAGKDPSDIIGITMPCFGTSELTYNNAVTLTNSMGCTLKTVDITESVKLHMRDIGLPEDDRSVAYENVQARERTQVLMDCANMLHGFVIGTGDLSEAALGWCTYNGDHMSMYNVNASVPKTLVRSIIAEYGMSYLDNDDYRQAIQSILDTPISPELLPPSKHGKIAQLTEDSVGPYILNDFFMYYLLRYGMSKQHIYELTCIANEQSNSNFTDDQIAHWLDKFFDRFFKAQFKRNCCPDGVKVGSVSLSPRSDWRCPSEFDPNAFVDSRLYR